jgi:cell wall-associated NlpC family hydrolase
MKTFYLIAVFFFFLFLQSCSSSRRSVSSTNDTEIRSRVVIKNNVAPRKIDTKAVEADELVTFAESLQGVPYKYGSADVKKGFDCSGFISYVFNHFKINVPRTSSDFTNAGKEVSMKDCRRGDIILFTGSDANSGIVGHMGIITANSNKKINFIHAASGGGKGVMISGMNEYFIPRFVKVIRVFSFPDKEMVS